MPPKAKVIAVPGDKYERLVVDEIRGTWAHCTCRCGNKHRVRVYHLRDKVVKSCGCLHRETVRTTRFKGTGELSATRWGSIKRDATRRDIPFEISMQYAWDLFLSQNRLCALSGLTLTMNRRWPLGSASLDRKDNWGGYLEGNVWWVHADLNRMKLDHPLEHFLAMCRVVTYHQEALKCRTS